MTQPNMQGGVDTERKRPRPRVLPIAEVTNLLNRVMIRMDAGDADGFADCYVAGGQCHVVLTKVVKSGRGELAAFCRFLKDKFPTAQHWEGNVTLRETTASEAARAKALTAPVKGAESEADANPKTDGFLCVANDSYWKAQDGADVIALGEHHDLVVSVDDGNTWRLAHREIRHTWTKATGHIPRVTPEVAAAA